MNDFKNNKGTVFSAIQPSGIMTLGNYIGAVKNWIGFQDSYNCIFSVANLHAVTVRQDPEEFRKNTLKAYALFLACGIDPNKSIFFIQSHVREHTELAWILDCYTQFGELSRMTQFKDKSRKYTDNINAGLFCYPVLMAADILLYRANLIPIGEDQKQHVEITRDIAQRFNGIYGDTFVIPKSFIPDIGARVMSLQDPIVKMSKSDSNPNAYISMLDNNDNIVKKIKRAVTDSGSEIKYTGEKTGINNLIGIYSSIANKSLEQVEAEFAGKGYGTFKKAVAEAVIEEISPVRSKFDEYIKDTGYIEKRLLKAAEDASKIAYKTMKDVKEKIGIL